MKQILFVLLVLSLFAPAAVVAQNQYDVPGIFSFTYGDGWTKGARKGAPPKELDWLVSTSNRDASFHPEVAESEVAFDTWVNQSTKGATPERAMVSKEAFTTASGVKGYKVVWKIKSASGQQFVRDQYFFRGKKDAKIELTGIAPEADAATFEPLYDGFAKSLVSGK